MSGMEGTISERGRAIAQTSLKARLQPLLSDLYDARDNPGGIVDMGTAENHIMTKDVSDFANRKIRTSSKTFTYGEGPWGSKRLRIAMANHMNKYFHPVSTVQPEDLVFANGITSLCELFGYAMGEEGDGILISRPCYQAFIADFGAKAKIKCVFVPSNGIDQFSAEIVESYETALLRAKAEGTNVRALLTCNPHNPLGRCYPLETIKALMQLCQKYSLHLLSDEVYALSVFDNSDPAAVKFTSVLSFDSTPYISPNYLHVVYGFSKDFAAGGLRLGCIYSRNTALMDTISAITQFSWSGPLNQLFAAEMLEDTEWLDEFFTKSQSVLKERNEKCRTVLEEYVIEYAHGANAGFFLWINLRPYLDLSTHPDEKEAENALVAKMEKEKIYLTQGTLLQTEEIGWFRIIYAQEDEVLAEGFRRLVKAIGAKKVQEGACGIGSSDLDSMERKGKR
ncbi:PLP-dependent transferase [Aureobasidium pullulans]|nr:PLP-dependent transferase [Aureobasidium pullulans]